MQYFGTNHKSHIVLTNKQILIKFDFELSPKSIKVKNYNKNLIF